VQRDLRRKERLAPLPASSIPRCVHKGRVEAWYKAFQGLFLGLGDRQLVTGLIILLIGFSETCQISLYDLGLAANLAYFSK
jgi:hypothetical protein